MVVSAEVAAISGRSVGISPGFLMSSGVIVGSVVPVGAGGVGAGLGSSMGSTGGVGSVGEGLGGVGEGRATMGGEGFWASAPGSFGSAGSGAGVLTAISGGVVVEAGYLSLGPTRPMTSRMR